MRPGDVGCDGPASIFMTLLDQDAFLTQFTRIIEKSRGAGTIYCTFKRCKLRAPASVPKNTVHAKKEKVVSLTVCAAALLFCAGIPGVKVGAHGGADPADYRCLVRAVGAKQKISAMISAKDYRRFMQSYGNILKVSLDSLKKKDKKKADPKLERGKSTRKTSAKGASS